MHFIFELNCRWELQNKYVHKNKHSRPSRNPQIIIDMTSGVASMQIYSLYVNFEGLPLFISLEIYCSHDQQTQFCIAGVKCRAGYATGHDLFAEVVIKG